MVKTGTIIKIKTAPHFRFQQWWVDVIVKTEDGKEVNTFVTGNTKLQVIQNSQLNKKVDFAC